jgi:hypothetical protein
MFSSSWIAAGRFIFGNGFFQGFYICIVRNKGISFPVAVDLEKSRAAPIEGELSISLFLALIELSRRYFNPENLTSLRCAPSKGCRISPGERPGHIKLKPNSMYRVLR